MRRTGRFDPFRPASWSFAARASVIPILGLAVTSIALAALISYTVRDLQLASVETDFELLGRAQARRVSQIIIGEASVLTALAQSEVVISYAEEHLAVPPDESSQADLQVSAKLHEEIELFLRRFPEFTDIVIVDANGRLIASNRADDMEMDDFSSEVWYEFVMLGEAGRHSLYLNDSRVFDPTVSASGMEVRGVEMALPVLNEENLPVAVIYAIWDVTASSQMTGGNAAERVIIQNGSGVVIADSLEELVGQQFANPRLEAAIRDTTSGATLTTDENGTRTIFGYSDVIRQEDLPELESAQQFGFDVAAPILALDWGVVVSQDATQILADIGVLVRRILNALLLGTLVVTAMAFFFARALVAPLARLTAAAQSIGEGNLATPIPDVGEDEVGQLAQVLRTMVSRLVRRVDQLRAATLVTQTAQSTLDLERMLSGVAEAIYANFRADHVRIYLSENGDVEQKRMTLYASAGDEDEPEASHRYVLVNAENIIGQAARLVGAQLASGEASQAEGRSEMAVPLRAGTELLGVLYLVAAHPDGFDENDLSVMELVADQLTTSVQNARLFGQREGNLREIEALNRRLTRAGWTQYVGQERQIRYALNSEDDTDAWPASLSEAAASGETLPTPLVDDDGQELLAVPIMLRGEVVGTLGVKQPAGYQWSDEEIRLMNSIAERVALVAEGIRLLDEADRRAQREQLIGSVSARLQSATKVDNLIQAALDELGGALGSSNISLRIGSPPLSDDEESPGANGNSDAPVAS